jgi:hypothetical protein
MQGGTKKKIVIATLVLVVLLGALAFYLNAALSSFRSQISQPTGPPAVPSISAQLLNQSFMAYSSGSTLLPYALIKVASRNASTINVYASIFKNPVPQQIYIFNMTNECYQCGNITAFTDSIDTSLIKYGLIKNSGVVLSVSGSELANISNYSILIVPNGYIPEAFMSNYSNTQNSTIQYLMKKGVSIIYVGADFSNMLEPGSIIVPSGTLPYFLRTLPFTKLNQSTIGSFGNFYFNKTQFTFASGQSYGYLSYENVLNGSIVAFSNYGTSWSNSTDEGRDIAKAISSLFWLPRYASGTQSFSLINSTKFNGDIGIPLYTSSLHYTYPESLALGKTYARIALYTNASYNITAPNSAYTYVTYTPQFGINGSVSIPSSIIPGQRTAFDLDIFTHSNTSISLLPHLQIYDQNMTPVEGIALPSIQQASGNFTFLKYLTLELPPGVYIAALDNFTDHPYAYGLFDVNLSVTLLSANFSSNQFTFYVSSAGQALSGVNYSVHLSNQQSKYAFPVENGTLTNGTIVYTVPSGAPALYYSSNITVNMLSSRFSFFAFNQPPPFPINTQDIEILVVFAVLGLMVVFVRAPNRDEFYIDVPHMPPKNKTQIKIKASEVTGIFDKLNLYYHWNHMPLSKSEIKLAISKYINFSGMPVNLTFSNVEKILDQLVASGKLVTVDGLYAPQLWVLHGHDIEYLATFKKLRVFLVSHGYLFTEIDASNVADIVATQHGEHAYIVIYSKTSRFANMPVFQNAKTYLAFLNSDRIDEFRMNLYNDSTNEAEMLKLYMASGTVELIDADNQQPILT